MIRMAFKRLLNRKTYSLATFFAMLAILMIVPLGIHFAQESKLTVQDTIEQYGRGSYDLLVRPANSRTPIEKKLGVVEENYIGDSSGGISIAEWKKIKQKSSVENAAPVSSLGYFAGNRTTVGLPLLDSPTRFNWQYYTTDGVHTYAIDEPGTVTYFEGQPMQYAEFITSSRAVMGLMGIYMPQNYYLLAAIDVESEQKLTGIDFSALHTTLDEAPDGMYLEGFIQTAEDAQVIPVLQRSDLHIPLSLSLTAEQLDISLTDYKNKYNVPNDVPIFSVESELEQELLQELDSEPVQSSEQFMIDLSTSQSPFNGNHVKLTNNFSAKKEQGGALSNDSSYYYTSSKIEYYLESDPIRVEIVENESFPTYKNIQQLGQDFSDDIPFLLWQMGTFTAPSDEHQLVSSPLGIYSTEDVTTEFGKRLMPTISPGSFIAQPAAGVTTLEAAELIKGDKPIDAIRIRVAGIDSYDSTAQNKIEQLATELFHEGYEVDIVAGSSFTKLEIDVEGIGLVTAPWTTLGVAQGLASGWNILTLITTLLFASFGIVWFASRLVYERNSAFAENEILLTLGWREGFVKRRNMYEQFLLLTSSFLLSMGILFFSNLQLNRIIYLYCSFIWLISAVMVWLFFWKNSKQANRTHAYKRAASLIHYRNLILPIMGVLTLSVLLVVIQLTSILLTWKHASETTLGSFTMDSTLYLQLFVVGTTILLATISVSEAMNAILYARKTEFHMYHTIGWSRKMIRRHFGREVLLWAGLSIIVGMVLSSLLLVLMGYPFLEIGVSVIGGLCLTVVPLGTIVRTRKFNSIS